LIDKRNIKATKIFFICNSIDVYILFLPSLPQISYLRQTTFIVCIITCKAIRQTTVNQGCIYLAILQQIKYTVNHSQIKRRVTDHCTNNGIGMLSHSKKQQAY